MITIEVTGFQSIAGATLQVEGFTALVGKSNIGKSAFIRAVRCALTNPTGTSFVRHARDCARQVRKAKTCECSASVHIVTEGFDLLWEKGDKVNRYAFNGSDYDKPDKGVPDFLTASGFALVKIGDKVGSVQVADQFFPIFLLDQSGPAIAEAISDVSQLDSINAATKLVEKERREVQSTRKVREGDIKELEGKLTLFETLDDALAMVRLAERALVAASAQDAKTKKLARFLAELATVQKELDALTQASLIAIPEIDTAVSAKSYANTLHEYIAGLTKRSAEAKALIAIGDRLKEYPEEMTLPSVVTKAAQVKAWVTRAEKLTLALGGYDSVANLDLPDVDQAPAQLSTLKAMLASAIRYLASGKDTAELEAQMKKLDAEEKALADQLEQANKALAEIKVCPTCTRPMKGDHSHATDFFSFQD